MALREIEWQEEGIVVYRDYLADFHGEFHDIRDDPRHKNCLAPDSYRASKKLASRLLRRGSAGVIFPSVRHTGGTSVGGFRPALAGNVREGSLTTLTFTDASRPPKIRVSH